jgi:hypothetical protein
MENLSSDEENEKDEETMGNNEVKRTVAKLLKETLEHHETNLDSIEFQMRLGEVIPH